MPNPMTRQSFDDINCHLYNAYVHTLQMSMKQAVIEVHEKTINKDENSVDTQSIVNTSVSGDGAWQKRGYS